MIRYRISYTYPVGNGNVRIGDGDFKAREVIRDQDDLDFLAHIIETVTGRSGVAIFRYRLLCTYIESDFV
ncbi:hypothetical protein Asp14428_65530 [Actinoplanes sp. NBRC 14428]|nr:hypothetical protein Asp14428_65530 [Actinoplanes sp. NBRC 14428]